MLTACGPRQRGSEPFVSIAKAPPAAAPASNSSIVEGQELREEVRELRAQVRQTNRRLDRVVDRPEGAIDYGVPLIVGRAAAGGIVKPWGGVEPAGALLAPSRGD